MANPLISDAEIKRRKKVQGRISQTTGALGLTSLGAFAASKAPGSARLVALVPKAKKINPKRAENIALGTSTAGAGIGGAGSFNFAAYTNAESRKRTPVKKNDAPSPFEDGFYGTTTEIAKAAPPKVTTQLARKFRKLKPLEQQLVAGGAAGAAAATLATAPIYRKKEVKKSMIESAFGVVHD